MIDDDDKERKPNRVLYTDPDKIFAIHETADKENKHNTLHYTTKYSHPSCCYRRFLNKNPSETAFVSVTQETICIADCSRLVTLDFYFDSPYGKISLDAAKKRIDIEEKRLNDKLDHLQEAISTMRQNVDASVKASKKAMEIAEEKGFKSINLHQSFCDNHITDRYTESHLENVVKELGLENVDE